MLGKSSSGAPAGERFKAACLGEEKLQTAFLRSLERKRKKSNVSWLAKCGKVWLVCAGWFED